MLLASCQDPSIVTGPDKTPDLSQVDAPPGLAAKIRPALPLLRPQERLEPTERWREAKRDPHYVVIDNTQHLFLSGSPVPLSGEAWSIGSISAPVGQDLNLVVKSNHALPPRPGAWDSGDLTGPTVLPPGGPRKGWTMWYSATGAAAKPAFVGQIGRAESSDGVTWQRGQDPVLAAPVFPGTDANADPSEPGPESHGLFDPSVLSLGNIAVWLYYTGLSCAGPSCKFNILRASSEDGLRFTRQGVVLAGRDVPEEAGGVAAPTVVQMDGRYYMIYTAVARPAARSQASIREALTTGTLAVAVSSDGQTFTNISGDLPFTEPPRSYYRVGSSGAALYQDGGAMRLVFAGLALAPLEPPRPDLTIGQGDLLVNQ